METTYLSDGAYVEWNGYAYVLFTSNGVTRTNEIHLDHTAIRFLQRFVETVPAKPR